MVRCRRLVDDFDLLGSMRERIVKLDLAVANQTAGPQAPSHVIPQLTIRGNLLLKVQSSHVLDKGMWNSSCEVSSKISLSGEFGHHRNERINDAISALLLLLLSRKTFLLHDILSEQRAQLSADSE